MWFSNLVVLEPMREKKKGLRGSRGILTGSSWFSGAAAHIHMSWCWNHIIEHFGHVSLRVPVAFPRFCTHNSMFIQHTRACIILCAFPMTWSTWCTKGLRYDRYGDRDEKHCCFSRILPVCGVFCVLRWFRENACVVGHSSWPRMN